MAVEAPKDPYEIIVDKMKMPGLRILELGTRRVEGYPSTARRNLAHPTSIFTASDVEAGDDVDVVADAHNLSKAFPRNSFDVVLACSVFEHIERPWDAMKQMAAVAKWGGSVFVQTHQSFPLHLYPHDYYRFSREALESLCLRAGLRIIGSAYNFPVTLSADGYPDLQRACAFLNVVVLAEKPFPARWSFDQLPQRAINKASRALKSIFGLAAQGLLKTLPR